LPRSSVGREGIVGLSRAEQNLVLSVHDPLPGP
jgi:hypothetical protein